jgi:hypothetical protein
VKHATRNCLKWKPSHLYCLLLYNHQTEKQFILPFHHVVFCFSSWLPNIEGAFHTTTSEISCTILEVLNCANSEMVIFCCRSEGTKNETTHSSRKERSSCSGTSSIFCVLLRHRMQINLTKNYQSYGFFFVSLRRNERRIESKAFWQEKAQQAPWAFDLVSKDGVVMDFHTR